MEKKKYSTDQTFIVIYAINSRKEIYDRFTIEKIDSTRLGLYDTIIEKNGEGGAKCRLQHRNGTVNFNVWHPAAPIPAAPVGKSISMKKHWRDTAL